MNTQTTLALIDGDVLAYTCLAAASTTKYLIKDGDGVVLDSCESGIVDGKNGMQRAKEIAAKYSFPTVIEKEVTEPPLSHVGHLVNETLEKVYARYESKAAIYLSADGKTWRHDLYPEYKADRPPRPRMLPEVRDMLYNSYRAISLSGYEADDHITIDCATTPSWVIVSKDKDFLQVPGTHYNPFSDVEKVVGPEEAYLNLWFQVLMGDAVDNIKGIPGVGKKTALQYLEQFDLDEIPSAVEALYVDSGLTVDDMLLNYRLVKLLDHVGEEKETPAWLER